MNIKVCVLSSVHQALDHRVFHKECRSLERAGYEVTLIARHPRSEVVSGIRIIGLAHPSGRISRILRTGWQIYRKALAERADIYHFHDPELIGVGLLLRLHGKRVISDVHEDVPEDLLHKFYLPVWTRRPISWIAAVVEGLSARLFSAVVTVNPNITERFSRFTSQVYMVRNFPILEEFPPAPDIPWVERDPAVMFLGSMAWNRGIRELVEAIDLVPDNLNPKLRLLGPFHEPDLPPILEKLPGWARTEVMGVVPRERVSEMMNRVRAGMLPAHPSRMYMLAYPVKMFEYMAAGIPVIISDFPAWREFVETAQCGLLVDPLDPRDIAKAIEYILSHPVEAAAMGRNARKAMQTEFNWSHEEKTLLGLYERLSEGLPRRT